MIQSWVKSLGISDVDAYFYVDDPERDLKPWLSDATVLVRGYMLGYNDLSDPAVSGFFRFLSRVADGMMKMRILRLDFHG